MGMVAYLKLDGIPGSVEVTGREETVEVIAFNHSVHLPVNELDGSITGNRRHGALEIVKVFDKASPLLYEALVNGKEIAEVALSWYRIDTATGAEENYFEHKMEMVRVVSIEPFMLNCHQHPDMQHMERVRFKYRKITWTWLPDNIEKSDSWTEER
ncbi:Hcp family type VI secretion system effector [bacterium]|nr:Hcp family type VI secretion system effector [candidate division CSSED10-310 bacterium]